MKYFVFTIDDGTIFDEKVIDIFNSFNIKATFNLNSGLQDFVWYKEDKPVRRLRLDEYKHLYDKQEIASHSLTHPHLTMMSDEDIKREVVEDINNLENIFHRKIKSFSIPFSDFDERVINIIKDNSDIKVIILPEIDRSFRLPKDPYHTKITTFNIDEALSLFDEFMKDDNAELFVFICHAYDFEYDWGYDKLKTLCQRVTSENGVSIIPVSEIAKLM